MRTTKEIIADINKVRAKQRSEFSSVADFIKHGKDVAKQKAKLFAELEKASKIEYPESYA